MSKLIEPPSFISETKSFETYKKDLERWAMLTTLDKTKQALLVVHMLDGDPSGIKEKIDENIEEEDLNSEDGIANLLEFLKSIYEKDSLSDGFEKYIAFEKFRRSSGKSIQEFIPEWTTAYKKAKNIGCELPDKVLSFKLLDAANLTSIERNLVLTGVDYKEAELLDQMQTALKKFIGRSALGQKEEQSSVDSTYLTADNFETVLLSKGWTKPRGGGRGGGRGRGGISKRALSELEDQLPNNEKAEWATMQHMISGENDFNKFRKFLKHRKDILDAVDMMVTRKDMPKDPDKPDPNQNVCDYCGMTRHLEEDCRRKKNDDEACTPGASRGSRGSIRGRGNVMDQRGQRANLPKCVSCQLSNPSHVSNA